MPAPRDFRNFSFDSYRLEVCGKHVGRHFYWKLYSIENLLRVLIHSILSVQISPTWWDVAVDPKIQKRAKEFREQYLKKPLHGLPGKHDVYYVFLSDLTKIILANSNLFLPVVPDIDQWVVKIENVRLPRNIVGHMNFPNPFDRQQISLVHSEMPLLIQRVQTKGVPIQIP